MTAAETSGAWVSVGTASTQVSAIDGSKKPARVDGVLELDPHVAVVVEHAGSETRASYTLMPVPVSVRGTSWVFTSTSST